jgi:N-acetylneuraminate synthase
MIRTAKEYCNADAVKFQKRNNRELLGETEYNAPHPNPKNSYGKTYGEHRDFLEFSLAQHAELKSYCEQLGIVYSTSVWDMTSAREIASLKPEFIKIPSAQNTNMAMLEWLAENYAGDIHLSVGMTTKKEIEDILDLMKQKNRNKNVVLYSCTSGYPVPFEDVCLKEILTLKQAYANDVKAIGFSGHHLGIAIDIAAFALGATWIERHFTLDRTGKGTDHAASLEPDGFRRLVRDLDAAGKALSFKEQEVLEIEQVQRKKLKFKSSSGKAGDVA